MSLQITTNCVRNSAGGTITGIVSLHLMNSPLEIEHLAVTLSGRAQTDIDQSTTKTPGCVFQGQRLLFATKRTLIKRPAIAAPGPSCSWHFESRIPNRCTAREAHAFRPFDRFNSDPEQQLPPAFASSCTKADGTHAANAAIIYELRASLLANETRLQAVEPVHFMSARPTEHPVHGETAAHAEVAFQSSRLAQHESTTSLHHHHDHRRSLRSTFTRKDVAFAAFWLVLRGSDKAIIGQPFPLHLSIRLEDSPSALPPTKPAVYLQKLKVILRAHNSIRCTGSECFKQSGCNSIHRGDEFEDWDEELLLESCDLRTSRPQTGKRRGRRGRSSLPRISSSRGIEIPTANDETTSGLDLRQHTTIPSYVVPSFKCHIISRTYTLETSVVVRCAEKDFPITFVNRDFELLAQDFAPEVRGPAATIDSGRTSRTFCSQENNDGLGSKLLQYA
ncbi:MAG: hypothetical protein LQ339_002537 [Xanthoria mediterranea]|nr:MAG: hypothetical protein LQ339_002537 [Xanthoria mediterranea]